MKFLNALEQLRWQNRRLVGLLAVALLINSLLLLGYFYQQGQLRIYVPPAIPQSGVILIQGRIPNSTVYSFAFYIWQRLNHWGNNGSIDYKEEINQLSPFLTFEFKQQLINDYDHRLSGGELQHRVRLMASQDTLKEINQLVQPLDGKRWQVNLSVHLIERISDNAKIIKDTRLRYSLIVVRLDVDRQHNPWGLALAGFAASPQRLPTLTPSS